MEIATWIAKNKNIYLMPVIRLKLYALRDNSMYWRVIKDTEKYFLE